MRQSSVRSAKAQPTAFLSPYGTGAVVIQAGAANYAGALSGSTVGQNGDNYASVPGSQRTIYRSGDDNPDWIANGKSSLTQLAMATR